MQGTLLHAERLRAAGLIGDAELTAVRETLAELREGEEDDADVPSFIARRLWQRGAQ